MKYEWIPRYVLRAGGAQDALQYLQPVLDGPEVR